MWNRCPGFRLSQRGEYWSDGWERTRLQSEKGSGESDFMRVRPYRVFLKRLHIVLSEMPCRLSSDVLLDISLFFFGAAQCVSQRSLDFSETHRRQCCVCVCVCDSSLDRLAVNGVIRIERSTYQ